MGIIKAVVDSVKGGLADTWLEVIEPADMGDQTVMTYGTKVRTGSNTKGDDRTVSNGSIIHVYDRQFMMLVDGGKVVDYTAEPGYYKVDNSSLPSMFNGEFGGALKESFNRIKFGGVVPSVQKVFFINLQEIKGIKFGTRNPINYFDNFYNAELFMRAHGSYSLKIVDPLMFYGEAIPRNKDQVEINSINEQYLNEFLDALQSAINQYSAEGQRVSFLTSKSRELSKYMMDILDEDWRQMRGMEIQSVGIASMSYDEESQKLLNMRNQGAMLSDAMVREGYVQGAIARGLEAAGSNENGAMNAFMGMGMGMNAAGGMMGAASATNMQQYQMQQQMQQQQQAVAQATASAAAQSNTAPANTAAGGWKCECGAENTGKFCCECGKPQPKPVVTGSWKCECGAENTGKFCCECGKPKPSEEWTCSCGTVNKGRFCCECGSPRP